LLMEAKLSALQLGLGDRQQHCREKRADQGLPNLR